MRAVQIQRINFLWFLTLGVTAVSAGVLVYLLLLESALGAFRISEASPTQLGVNQRPIVGILESASSRVAHERLFLSGVGKTRYDSMLVSWERVLSQRLPDEPTKLSDENLLRALSNRSNGLESLSGENHDILVLPAALTLSDEQLVLIEEFVRTGGSLLVSWSVGLYDENQRWRGWGFLERTMGIQFDRYIEPGPGAFRVSTDTFPGVVPAGVYVPDRVFDTIKGTRLNNMSAREAAELRQAQEQASARNFAPLNDYVWVEPLGIENPSFDYATVEGPVIHRFGSTTTEGVIVKFYTWRGVTRDFSTPYPRTSGATRRFTLRGNTPLSAGIPGGYRAKIQVYNPGVSVRISDSDRAQSAGFWHDFATDLPLQQEILNPASGLVYGTLGDGRFVFMGFSPDALGASAGDPEDEQVLARLFDNVLSFLQREPIVWTHDWPHGQAAALVIASIMDESGANEFSLDQYSSQVSRMVSFFENEHVPATVFVDRYVGSKLPEFVSRLYDQGDVGVYDLSAGQISGSIDVRRRRLRSTREALMDVVQGPVAGYRSSRRGALSKTTKEALSLEGFSYFLPDSIGRRTTPKIMGAPFESLTRIGVTSQEREISELFTKEGSKAAVDSLLLPSAYRGLDEGGIFRLTIPVGAFGSEAQVSELSQLILKLRQEKFWMASGRDIAHWWRLRNGLNVSVEQRSKSRIFVRVSNDNGDTAAEATVSIALGEPVTSVNIRPELINILKSVADDIDVPPYVLRENGTVLDLIIKQLKPQQYRIFHIDLISPAFTKRLANH